MKLSTRHYSATIAFVPFMELNGVASGIGINADPQTLFGHSVVMSASGAFGVGAGAVMGVQGMDNAVDFDIGVQLTHGMGFQVGVSNLEISPR